MLEAEVKGGVHWRGRSSSSVPLDDEVHEALQWSEIHRVGELHRDRAKEATKNAPLPRSASLSAPPSNPSFSALARLPYLRSRLPKLLNPSSSNPARTLSSSLPLPLPSAASAKRFICRAWRRKKKTMTVTVRSARKRERKMPSA